MEIHKASTPPKKWHVDWWSLDAGPAPRVFLRAYHLVAAWNVAFALRFRDFSTDWKPEGSGRSVIIFQDRHFLMNANGLTVVRKRAERCDLLWRSRKLLYLSAPNWSPNQSYPSHR